mgnify:FL=1
MKTTFCDHTVTSFKCFGKLFFFLLAIAALTSTIALLEVVVSYFIDQLHWKRGPSALVVGSCAFLLGIPSALSNGSVDFFSGFMDVLFDYFFPISLASGALLICIFAGWKWGTQSVMEEVRSGCPSFKLAPVWTVLVRYVCPVAIAFIILGSVAPWVNSS